MLFEETFDDRSELGIPRFGCVGRYAGNFSQYVTAAVVTGAVVLNGLGIPAHSIFNTLRFPFVQNGDKSLQGP